MVRTLLLLALAAPLAAAAQSSKLALGEKVFNGTCKSCHDTGKTDNDAPQLSHREDWRTRLKSGRDALYRNSIDGLKGYFEMPARGGNPRLSDDDVKAAVDYILERAGAR